MVIFTLSILDLFCKFYSKKTIWHFDITLLVFQQFTRSDFKPVGFLVLITLSDSVELV